MFYRVLLIVACFLLVICWLLVVAYCSLAVVRLLFFFVCVSVCRLFGVVWCLLVVIHRCVIIDG